MATRRLLLAPAAIGLVLANALSIVVVIGSCLTATHAAQARDRALTALAESQRGLPPEAALRAPAHRVRVKRVDRLLLLGALGVLGSALSTWWIVRAATRYERAAGSRASAGHRRRRVTVELPLSRSWW